MDADPLEAARERLADELAGGRWLLLPPGGAAEAGDMNRKPPEADRSVSPEPEAQPVPGKPEQSPEMAGRIRRFRERKRERAAREAAQAAAAARVKAAPPPAGISARGEESIFGSERLTDPAQGAAERLGAMEKAVAGCRLCELHRTRTNVVFGDGPPEPELVFVGEAPGADEDASGVPFVGRAGKLLDKIIAAMGLARGEVYICNVLKCRPPGNRTPLPGEVGHCWPYLREQLEILAPKVICALGAPAARTLLGTDIAIGRLRGARHDYHGTPLVATYHPAYLLRSPGEKGKVWEDMKLVLRLLGRPVPKKKTAP